MVSMQHSSRPLSPSTVRQGTLNVAGGCNNGHAFAAVGVAAAAVGPVVNLLVAAGLLQARVCMCARVLHTESFAAVGKVDSLPVIVFSPVHSRLVDETVIVLRTD